MKTVPVSGANSGIVRDLSRLDMADNYSLASQRARQASVAVVRTQKIED